MSYREALVYLYRVLRWKQWRHYHERLCRAIEVVLDKLAEIEAEENGFQP